IIVSTHDLAEAERCSHIALLSAGRAVAVGTPEQISQSVPACAFLLSGTDARLLAQPVNVVPGVLASYPQGANLRIIAEAEAEPGLQGVASAHAASLTRVALRLEDAGLVFSRRLSRSGA
ncbi:MAG: hypothetical protein ACRDJC_14660, partial [Thermomicrobiales bacterium]